MSRAHSPPQHGQTGPSALDHFTVSEQEEKRPWKTYRLQTLHDSLGNCSPCVLLCRLISGLNKRSKKGNTSLGKRNPPANIPWSWS